MLDWAFDWRHELKLHHLSPQEGCTALMKAAERGHVAVVQALLKACADIEGEDKVSGNELV